MEFGVREGTTIEQFLKYNPAVNIHGFDSWEGLPEDWDVGNKIYQPGDMAVPMPEFDSRVELWRGWFEDTIDPWKNTHDGPIQLLHVDGDLYSSAKTVLTKLNDRIVPGTVIIFDEIRHVIGNKKGIFVAKRNFLNCSFLMNSKQFQVHLDLHH